MCVVPSHFLLGVRVLHPAVVVAFKVYATRAPAAPATWVAICGLAAKTRMHPRPLPFLQQQLAVGWGTARVAVGMALGSSVYERSKAALEESL
jgi:hypothetical protein